MGYTARPQAPSSSFQHGPIILPPSQLSKQRVFLVPKGPYTANLRTLAPKTILGILSGTRVLKWAVYGPFLKSSIKCSGSTRLKGSQPCRILPRTYKKEGSGWLREWIGDLRLARCDLDAPAIV